MSSVYNIDKTCISFKLTDREVEVLYLVAHEYSNRQIASMLFLSVHTVDTYRRHLFSKFDVHNAAGLVRRAFELELFPMTAPRFINGVPEQLASSRKCVS